MSGAGWLRDLRRVAPFRRRLLAAGLAAAAVGTGLAALRPAPAPTVGVLVAARDLPGGAPLTRADVRVARLPPDSVPSGALSGEVLSPDAVLAGPVRQGEPLTDVRILGPSLLAGYGEGLVAAPVRIADGGVARLLRPGDRIDVLAATDGGAVTGGVLAAEATELPARVVASGVRVVTVPRSLGESGDHAWGDAGDTLVGGALVVLATTPAVAADLARTAVTSRLSVVLRASS